MQQYYYLVMLILSTQKYPISVSEIKSIASNNYNLTVSNDPFYYGLLRALKDKYGFVQLTGYTFANNRRTSLWALTSNGFNAIKDINLLKEIEPDTTTEVILSEIKSVHRHIETNELWSRINASGKVSFGTVSDIYHKLLELKKSKLVANGCNIKDGDRIYKTWFLTNQGKKAQRASTCRT